MVIGFAAFLLGLSGLFWLPDVPPEPAFLLLVEVGGRATPDQIVASWSTEAGAAQREETAVRGRERGIWLFYEAPEAAKVTLTFYRHWASGRQDLGRREAVLQRGRVTKVDLSD